MVEEPQLIYDHNQLVAVVIKADVFEEFLAWQHQHQKLSLADAFADLRKICIEENYTLETPPRNDRPNSFADSLHDISL